MICKSASGIGVSYCKEVTEEDGSVPEPEHQPQPIQPITHLRISH